MNIQEAMAARNALDSGVGYVEALKMPLAERMAMNRRPGAVIPVTAEEIRSLRNQPVRDPREDWRD